MLSVDQWGESHVAALSPYLLWKISSRRNFNAYRQDTGLPGISEGYLGCYERDEYVLAPFYVYISKSKNGWQYLDSLGGAAYTSAKEEYVEHPFLVIQTAMHHAGAHNRNEVDYE